MRRSPVLLLSLAIFLASTALAATFESRRVLEQGEDGVFLLQEQRSGETELPAEHGPRDDILWHRYQASTFYSTSIGNVSSVFSGAYDGLAMHELAGDGTPLWTVAGGTGYGTAGAKSADLFSAVMVNEAIAGATLGVWNAGNSTPIWSKDIPDCSVPDECIRVSDDGGRVVLGLNMAFDGGTPRIYTFDAMTGGLISRYDGNTGSFLRSLEISDDGSLAAMRASADLHVVETDTGTARWTGNSGASADGLAFSGDGEWIASGWTFLMVWHWNGASYDFAWSNNGGGTGWYLGRCAFSSSGGALLAAFYTTSYNQLRVMWFDPASSIPAWTYNSPLSSGYYQEIPSAIDMASSGQFAVLGSWGDHDGINPEIHVFGPAASDPLYTVDSPGSIFSVAVRDDGGGIVASGCGKHVHANEFGSGGDIYSFEVGPPTSLPSDSPGVTAKIAAFPNPFNPKVTLEVALPADGPLALDIYSPEGRKLRELARGEFASGLRVFEWDGRDAAGHPLPSGIYLAHARIADGEAVQRLVMLR